MENLWSSLLSVSVHDLIVLIVRHQVSKDIIGVSAGEVAEACVDPHVLPGEYCSIGTLKLHLDSLRLVRDAAAFI